MKNSKQTLRISQDCTLEKSFCADFGEEGAEHLAYNQTPAQATVEALTIWGLEADDVNVVYDSTCHFLCDITKCLVPATPHGDCPGSAH